MYIIILHEVPQLITVSKGQISRSHIGTFLNLSHFLLSFSELSQAQGGQQPSRPGFLCVLII